MKTLKLYADPSCKVRHPNRPQVHGTPANYIGWAASANGGFELSSEPSTVNLDGSQAVNAFVREAKRDKCVRAADTETASFLGLPFEASKPKKGDS